MAIERRPIDKTMGRIEPDRLRPEGLSFPVLTRLGSLTPDPKLLAHVLSPGFRIGEFLDSTRSPKVLDRFLAKHGYTPTDTDGGMVFASTCGVSLHVDPGPSVLWVLGGEINHHHTSHQLIVGDQDVALKVGDVHAFDARLKHGVIASLPGLWVAFSVFVQRSPEGA